jgi:hypothetical protein
MTHDIQLFFTNDVCKITSFIVLIVLNLFYELAARCNKLFGLQLIVSLETDQRYEY